MYDTKAFVVRIGVHLIEIVKSEGRDQEWMEVLKHVSWGLDEHTFSCSGNSDSDFPFPGTHLPWLSTRFCLVTAFPLSFLIILSFLTPSWLMLMVLAS